MNKIVNFLSNIFYLTGFNILNLEIRLLGTLIELLIVHTALYKEITHFVYVLFRI